MTRNDETSIPHFTFNDDFIREKSHCDESQVVEAFRFDYSPKNGQIMSIEPLQKFKSLKELSLVGHNLVNISNIQSLISLRSINLSWNNLAVKNIQCLSKIQTLETITLNNNSISEIPKSFSSLINLRILRLGSNPISDRSQFSRLKQNINLTNLDLEGCPVFKEDSSLSYCIFILPQLSILNRKIIQIEERRKASERFEHEQIDELTNINNKLEDENAKLLEENKKLSNHVNLNQDNSNKYLDENRYLKQKFTEL